MLKLEMLCAGHGDCLWIEYGDPGAPRRVLVDGGAVGTYARALRPRLLALPEAQRRFELLVVTHVDADHITGVLDLLKDGTIGFHADDVWFNGYRHLPDEQPDTLGPVQGEQLTSLLLRPGMHWNASFESAAVAVPARGSLPRVELEGGLVLTLLSPTPDKLATLKPAWTSAVRKAGLDPDRRPEQETAEGFALLGASGPPDVEALAKERFSEDGAEANGSTIAVIAEFEGRRVLLGGDAHPGVLQASIDRLSPGAKLSLDACKLPHHGSKANLSRELLDTVACQQYLFSTNGAYFSHPDRQAVARVITWGGPQPVLTFNYRTQFNQVWDAKPLRDRYGYTTVFPRADAAGAAVEWH